MNTLGFALLGYLLGSIPFAVLSSRLFGLADPRSYGSGNPGATNVLRSGNKLAALTTLLGDGAKGWLAVFLAQLFSGQPQDVALAGFAAFFGHLHPIFLNFRGGKGVSVAAGVLLGFNVLLGLAVLLTWALTAWISRYASLGSIGAAVTAPLFALTLLNSSDQITAVFCMALLMFWRHSPNLQRIRAGSEPKIGEKRQEEDSAP